MCLLAERSFHDVTVLILADFFQIDSAIAIETVPGEYKLLWRVIEWLKWFCYLNIILFVGQIVSPFGNASTSACIWHPMLVWNGWMLNLSIEISTRLHVRCLYNILTDKSQLVFCNAVFSIKQASFCGWVRL